MLPFRFQRCGLGSIPFLWICQIRFGIFWWKSCPGKYCPNLECDLILLKTGSLPIEQHRSQLSMCRLLLFYVQWMDFPFLLLRPLQMELNQILHFSLGHGLFFIFTWWKTRLGSPAPHVKQGLSISRRSLIEIAFPILIPILIDQRSRIQGFLASKESHFCQ